MRILLPDGSEFAFNTYKKADSFPDGVGYLAERPENYRLGDIVISIRTNVKEFSVSSDNGTAITARLGAQTKKTMHSKPCMVFFALSYFFSAEYSEKGTNLKPSEVMSLLKSSSSYSFVVLTVALLAQSAICES